jgi:hypothetical protein
LNDNPDDSEHRLLVPHLDIAPGEEIEKLAIIPKLAETD